MPVGSALAQVVRCARGQRETRLTYTCACGETVYGVITGPAEAVYRCATCAMRAGIEDAAAVEAAIEKHGPTLDRRT